MGMIGKCNLNCKGNLNCKCFKKGVVPATEGQLLVLISMIGFVEQNHAILSLSLWDKVNIDFT